MLTILPLLSIVIIRYYSIVGDDDKPYPVAIGKKNVYFMLDQTYVSNVNIPILTENEEEMLYLYYYGFEGDEPLGKYATEMDFIKIIDKK